MKTPKDSAEETVTKPSTKSEKSEAPAEEVEAKATKKKSGTKKAKAKLPEKKSKKGAKKAMKTKTKGKVLKFEPKDNRILGKYRPTGHKGQIVAHAIEHKSITEQAAQKIAGKGVNVQGIFYRIRKFGKRSGLFNFFPSQRTEGKWVFKMLKPMPKVKMEKPEKKAHKKAA